MHRLLFTSDMKFFLVLTLIKVLNITTTTPQFNRIILCISNSGSANSGPWAKSGQPATYFCKQSFIGICSCPFIYTLSVAIFMLQPQSWVVATVVWPAKPEIFTICTFTRKVYRAPIIKHKENKLCIQNSLLLTWTKENKARKQPWPKGLAFTCTLREICSVL